MSTKKYIRFISSDYQTLFYLPDGGRIKITYPDGKQVERVCQFNDEYHTVIGNCLYHICEFAELMERNGATCEPLDYIQEPQFYRKILMTRVAGIELPPGVIIPAYYVIDETADYGMAFAPKGAPKGRRYCVFQKLPDKTYPSGYRIGQICCWSGNLKDTRPQDYGFNIAKIKAVTRKPRERSQPER